MSCRFRTRLARLFGIGLGLALIGAGGILAAIGVVMALWPVVVVGLLIHLAGIWLIGI